MGTLRTPMEALRAPIPPSIGEDLYLHTPLLWGQPIPLWGHTVAFSDVPPYPPLHKKYHEPKECHVETLHTPLSVEKGHVPRSNNVSPQNYVGVSSGCVQRRREPKKKKRKPPLESVSPLFFIPEGKHYNGFIADPRRIFERLKERHLS